MCCFSLDACFQQHKRLPFESTKTSSFFPKVHLMDCEASAPGSPNVRHNNKQAGHTVLRVTISRFLLIPPTTTHIQK